MEVGMIVVAAGYGSFRSEHGVPVPKVVELLRNIPLIAYPLRNAREIGITRVVVVLNPRDAPSVVKAIEYAVRVGVLMHMPEIVIQPSRAGSADAVLLAAPLLRKRGVQKALVTYGDMPLWDVRTFRELTFADVTEATATMVTVQRGEKFPMLERYGRVVRQRDRSIQRIVEVDDPGITVHEQALVRVNPSLWIWDLAWLEDAIPRIVPFKKSDGYGDERYMPPLVGQAVSEGRTVRELALSPLRSREALGVNTLVELQRVQRFKI